MDPTPSVNQLLQLRRQAGALRRQILLAKTAPDRQASFDALLPILGQIAAATQALNTARQGTRTGDGGIRLSESLSLAVAVKRYVATSTANLRSTDETDDTAALVRYTLTSNGGDWPGRVRFTSVIDGYSAPAVDTVAPDGAVVFQRPTFHVQPLKAVTELTIASVRLRAEILTRESASVVWEKTYPITLLARDTLFAALESFDGTLTSYLDWLGAFVTPSAPEVHAVLRDAATAGPILAYTLAGVSANPQVKAIYDALKARNIAYVDTTESLGPPVDYSQRVRLPRESLAEKAANCVDATVLFASILEAATLKAGIGFLPDHTVVAWQPTDGGAWQYLDPTEICIDHSDSFEEAQQVTNDEIARNQATFKVASLDALRGEGIFPME